MPSSLHPFSSSHHQYHVHSRPVGQEIGKVASGRSHCRCCSNNHHQPCHAGISKGPLHQDAGMPLQGLNVCRRRCLVTTRSQASRPASTQPDQPRSAADQPFLRVVLPTALGLMLCNMDRICLSVAIIPMSAEFGWAGGLQGVIQSSFLWGYMATQLLGGALADRFGGKRVLAGGIAWFSAASLLLPAALSPAVVASGLALPAMLMARCFVGLGEGVALPSMNNLVATYVPKEAKARALGMCFTGFHTGNLLGLILSPLILSAFGWRALFCVFGFFGLPLLAMWLSVVPDTEPSHRSTPALDPTSSSSSSSSSSPSSSPSNPASSTAGASPADMEGISQGSGQSIEGREGGASTSEAFATADVSIISLMSKPATWAIVIVNVVNHFGYFIYLNWMPTYFVKALGFDLRASSFMAFLPWLVMAVGSSLSGVLADALVARGIHVTQVRKAVQTVAFLVPAVALMVLSQPGLSPKQAVVLMTIALGTTSLGQAGFVANMSDIAPRQAGKMFGLSNTFGSLSGIVGVTAVGFIVEATNSFSPVFQLTAGLYVMGTLVWWLLATGERVFD
ncbi:major facilitator superfamily domain-containing protein [Dunaliella salina]|uniref:Major facilitator superfamily domain-containing protein n=1 Tax=Dunaliella salina TaxID=3046 RepID=A0ABQ7G5C3_DUNSA|nr:major facilitator superfamily domain-containing protein [Dunaliella salina]|eukprot:KAF5829807.1 major facilitator superfamily domain-containing protein [Dunaliella salina]